MDPDEKEVYDKAFKKERMKIAAKQGAEDAKKPPQMGLKESLLNQAKKALTGAAKEL